MIKDESKPRAHGLRSLRIDRKLSQVRLGEKLGVSARSVQRYESLKFSPKPFVVDKMCEVLRCERWQLLHKNPLGTARRSKRKSS